MNEQVNDVAPEQRIDVSEDQTITIKHDGKGKEEANQDSQEDRRI